MDRRRKFTNIQVFETKKTKLTIENHKGAFALRKLHAIEKIRGYTDTVIDHYAVSLATILSWLNVDLIDVLLDLIRKDLQTPCGRERCMIDTCLGRI